MSHTVRAKFRVDNVRTFASGRASVVEFAAVHDDGTPENQRYAKYTPAGTVQLHVDNPDVVFTPGQVFYLDFTPAD